MALIHLKKSEHLFQMKIYQRRHLLLILPSHLDLLYVSDVYLLSVLTWFLLTLHQAIFSALGGGW